MTDFIRGRESNSVRSPHNKLATFLLGTIDSKSPLRLLRGQEDTLRIIWTYACSEWWSLHIERYVVPSIESPNYDDHGRYVEQEYDALEIPDLRKHDLFERKKYFDCPLLVVNSVEFPPLCTIENGPLNVNMMPFDLFDPEGTLPPSLYGYLSLIEECRRHTKAFVDMKHQSSNRQLGWREVPRQYSSHVTENQRVAYLTVDERPVQAGLSQRRGGVHVECPGAMRSREVGDKSKYTSDLSFYHPWGIGRAVDEFLDGGIFIASNVDNTTGVWNCRVHDTFGDVIGPHGSLERMRDVLGPPTKMLSAGELVWLSDRTPHESLPVNQSANRQFFRLVVGEIAFWFPEHNTPNPTGYSVPASVSIVAGNKFDLIKQRPVVWECGNSEEIAVAREEAEFREVLYSEGIGFMADDLLRRGIYNRELLRKHSKKAEEAVKNLDPAVFSSYTKMFVDVGLSRIDYKLR